MKITIVGTGYQGLVVGTCLADNGHQVICVDRDKARIEALALGKLPIHEPGLEELVARNLEEERLSFTTDLGRAIADCLAVFLCVGTPLRADGSADVSEVLEATRQLATSMNGYRILVNKSTCPPGTADEMERILQEHAAHGRKGGVDRKLRPADDGSNHRARNLRRLRVGGGFAAFAPCYPTSRFACA